MDLARIILGLFEELGQNTDRFCSVSSLYGYKKIGGIPHFQTNPFSKFQSAKDFRTLKTQDDPCFSLGAD